MAPTKSGLTKELLSNSAPCNFVSKTKQLLEEIERSKGRIGKGIGREADKDINNDETKEYYNMIDTSVTDQDALEWLRLRRLLRDSIKATETEVQDSVKKLLASNSDCQEASCHNQSSNLNISIQSLESVSQKSLQSTTPAKRPPVKSSYKTTNPHPCQPVLTRSRTSSPHQCQPELTRNQTSSPYTCQLGPNRSQTSSPHQCQRAFNQTYTKPYPFQPVSTRSQASSPHQHQANQNRNQNIAKSDVSLHTVRRKQVTKIVNNNNAKEDFGVLQNRQYCAEPNILEANAVVNNEEVPLVLSDEFMTKTAMYPSLYNKMKYPRNREKYFPCAIPLADPSRKRKEVPSDCENFVAEQTPSNTAPVFAPKTNVLVVNIDAEKSTKPQLVDQILPSMDIQGKPFRPIIQNNAQLISIRAEEPPAEKADKVVQVSAKEETDQRLHTHDSYATYIETDQTRVPEQICHGSHRETSSRLNPAVLSEIIAAIRRSQKEIQSANGKVSNQNSLHSSEINVNAQEVPCKNLNSQNVNEKPKSVEMETKEVQTSCESFLPPVASEFVQVSPPIIHVTEKSLQTEVQKAAVSEHCAQTDLQGQLDSLLVFKQRDAKLHTCSGTQCDILPLLPTIVRTSTPVYDIGDEIQSFHPTVSDLSHPDKYENDMVDNISKVATKDIGTQCFAEVECQTLPELSSASMQTEFAIPCTSVHTMTAGIESNDISVQVNLDAKPIGLQYNEQANSVVKAKEVGTQSEPLDVSASSATYSQDNPSDSEFVDDLLSEGEIPLPWNLRLLSLIDQTIGYKHAKPQESNGENGNSLSEGEIPPHLLQHLRDAMSSENSDAAVFPSGSDALLDFISEKPSPYLQTPVSAGQMANVSVAVTETSSSSSDLVQPSTSGDVFSEGEIAPSESELGFQKPGTSGHPTRYPSESFEFIPSSSSLQIQNTQQEHSSDGPQRTMSKDSDPFYVALSNFFSGATYQEKGGGLVPRNENTVTTPVVQPTYARQDVILKQSEKIVSRAPDLKTVIEESSTGSNSLNDQGNISSTQVVQTAQPIVNTIPGSESEEDFGSFYDVPKIVIEGDDQND